MLQRGSAVKSLSGRDKDKLLCVMQTEKKRVLLCDGKERPVERPKSKNIRHVKWVNASIKEEDMLTNKALKRALRRLDAEINGNT